MLPNHIYVSAFEAQIPELRDALAVLQGTGVVHVVLIEDSVKRPQRAHCVLPDDIRSDARICSAAEIVSARLGVPIRSDRERPFGSIEQARARGFSDEEIVAELRPWRAAGVAATEREVQQAEAALKEAQADLVAARKRADAPLDDSTG